MVLSTSSFGEVDSLGGAAARCAGGGGDEIRSLAPPSDAGLLVSDFFGDVEDPDFGGAFNSSAVNCWMALTCSSDLEPE